MAIGESVEGGPYLRRGQLSSSNGQGHVPHLPSVTPRFQLDDNVVTVDHLPFVRGAELLGQVAR